MGAYLTKPITDKETHGDSDAHFNYGVSAMQGWRTSMEDAHVATLGLGGVPNAAFFGVFDGHGGAQVARYCSLMMPDELLKNGAYQAGEVGPALKQTFLGIDVLLKRRDNMEVLEKLKADGGEEAGLGQLPASLQKLLQSQLQREDSPDDDAEGGGGDNDVAMHDDDDDDDDGQTIFVPGIGHFKIQHGPSARAGPSAGPPVVALTEAAADEVGAESDDAPMASELVVSKAELVEAVEEEDGIVKSEDGTYQGPSAGCTSVVAVVVGKMLYVANAGDSRCVLCRGTTTVSLTQDHKPTDPEEESRILAAGGFVTDGRVNGCLNLSRAIGDMNYKQSADKPAEEQIVTANPDIREIELTAEDKFILLACDGIWDILTNEEAVKFIDERLSQGKTPKEVCEMLCDRCLASTSDGIGKGCDNMSAMIVLLKTPGE